MLAMFDVGTFISAPVVGTFLQTARNYTANPYPWMFAAVAVVFAAVTTAYCVKGGTDTARGPLPETKE